MSETAWGIDLGTTNSCIARATAAGVEVVRIDESPTVPSVVAWDGARFLVGRRAANHAVLAPDQAVRSIKRHMGESSYRVALGGAELSPIEVSAKILAYLREEAQRAVGEAIDEAVITVPAWFNEPQRRATILAGEQAGLKVTRIINEPTAAGLAYGHTSATHTVVREPGASERWLVYDLGGGTFDVSILAVAGSYKEVLASCGNTYLGGDDFDHRIVLHWVDRLRDRHSLDVMQDRVAMAQLRHLAEQTKIRLSTEVEVSVHAVIESAGRPLELEEGFTRPQFAAMIDDYVASTLVKVRQALEEARVTPGELSRALLVGGSTRIPCVQARVAQELGIEPDAYVDVDLSVALGAGMQSALDHSLSSAQIVVDIAPHSLGIAAVGEEDEERMLDDFSHALAESESAENEDPVAYPYTFAPVIRRNSRLPARFVEQFRTGYDGQDGAEIVVLQGESSNTRENTLIGAFHVPFTPKPAGSPVHVCFEYDRSGTVRVSVSEHGGAQVLKARTLDLGRSAQSNSEAVSLTRLARESYAHESHEDDARAMADDEAIELGGGAPSAPQVSNYLIEQVERQLAGRRPEEMADTRADLETYRALLASGRDSEIDAVEERLYSWLDSVKAPGGAPGEAG